MDSDTRKALLILAMASSLAGCLTDQERVKARLSWADRIQTTAIQRAALDEARATGATCRVPKAEIGDAWARAGVFVAKHASMKVQIANDFTIETYNPTSPGEVGYTVRRTPQGDNVLIEVTCTLVVASTWGAPGEDREAIAKGQHDTTADNAALAARYIRTGDVGCEPCIAQ